MEANGRQFASADISEAAFVAPAAFGWVSPPEWTQHLAAFINV